MRFANVEAELHGADLAFGVELTPSLTLDGNAAYVRGKRRDLADNLYRIAPPNARLGLSWRRQALRVALEQEVVAKQNNTSAELTDDPASRANRFEGTAGYGLTHLYASYEPNSALRLDLGVENLFDKRYRDPLAGFNRNRAAGEIGQRPLGRGRNAFVRLRCRIE